MKILLIAPPYQTLPTELYGAIERISVARYIELGRAGFDPILLGPVGTYSSLRNVIRTSLVRLPGELTRSTPVAWYTESRVLPYSLSYLRSSRLSDYDVAINDAFRIEPPIPTIMALKFGVTRSINVLHGPQFRFTKWSRIALLRLTVGGMLGALNRRVTSWFQSRGLKVCYFPNGIEVSSERAMTEPENYWICIGRLDRAKRPDVAIRLAKCLNRDLIIAGPIKDAGFFASNVLPLLDERRRYVGVLPRSELRELLTRAAALCYVGEGYDPQPTVVPRSASPSVSL